MNTRDFIIDFFTLEDGVRCRVRHPHSKSGPQYKNDRSMRSYGYALTDINEHNYDWEFRNACTQHFLMYIFDEGIRKCQSKAEIADHIIGVTPVMDVDSPHLHHQTSMRYDALGHRTDSVLRKFELIHQLVKKELDDSGLWEDTRMMWSGNGFYIILPDFIGDKEEIREHCHNFVTLEHWINIETGFSEPLVDQRHIGWNRYVKIPLTRHSFYPDRFSVPINKECNVSNVFDTTDWIKEV